MKKRLFILLSLFIAILNTHVCAQIVNFNMEEGNTMFPVSAIDSITFETDENDIIYQILWSRGESFRNSINDEDYLNFSFDEVVFNISDALEYGYKTVITTNYGQFGAVIEDTISSNGHFIILGNTSDLEDVIIAHIDTLKVISSIYSDSLFYDIHYYEEYVSVLVSNTNYDTVSYDIINNEDFDLNNMKNNLDSNDLIHSNWFNSLSIIDMCMTIKSPSKSSLMSTFLQNKNNKVIQSLGDISAIISSSGNLLSRSLALLRIMINIRAFEIWHFAYLETMDAELITPNSVILGCRIGNFSTVPFPAGTNVKLICTMKISCLLGSKELTKTLSDSDTLYYYFDHLRLMTLYDYQPKAYLTWTEYLGNVTIGGLFEGFSGPAIIPCGKRSEIPLYGVTKEFVTRTPVANTDSILDTELHSVRVKCSYYGIVDETMCGIEISDGVNSWEQSVNNTEGAQTLSISGLNAATSYSCRAYVKYLGGTYYGEWLSFTTDLPDITGTWTCTETHYSSSGEPSYTSYEITLFEDGTVDCPTYPVISEGLPPGTYSVGNNGSVGISIHQLSQYTYYWHDSGVEWYGHIEDLDNPTTIIGYRYNWNYNNVGYFEGDHIEMTMTR